MRSAIYGNYKKAHFRIKICLESMCTALSSVTMNKSSFTAFFRKNFGQAFLKGCESRRAALSSVATDEIIFTAFLFVTFSLRLLLAKKKLLCRPKWTAQLIYLKLCKIL